MVATGTPEQVAKAIESYTGHYLKQLLDRRGGVATIASGKAASGNASRGRPTQSEAAE